MFDAVYYKFKQNIDILEKLLNTGNAEIIEATVKENYWGCGPNNDGQNNYGKIVVKVREILRKEQKKEDNVMELISKEGYKGIRKEYDEIDNELIKVQKAMGESAKRDNDLRENPEYMQLRVKAMYEIPKRKEKLLNRLKECKFIEDQDEYKNFDGSVIAGSKVKITFDGEKEEYSILGDKEGSFEENIMSCKAPLAQTLLGKRAGDTVNFNNTIIIIEEVTKI